MFIYMLVTLVVFAFAGTVLMHPAFRSDLVDFVGDRATRGVESDDVEKIVADISVIIPARNEEETLPALLKSLDAQSISPREILVVDDQSEDRTAAAAANMGVRVISAGERPPDWLGKPWTVHTGASVAQGRYLLFLDADVRLYPNALESLGRAFLALSPNLPQDATTLSVQPYHRTVKARERLAFLFNILVFVGLARRNNRMWLTMEGGCCFGPCILCGRREYMQFGGHGAVRQNVLDDIELGDEFRRAGVSLRSFSGRGIVEFRMYPSGVRALLDGFTKNVLLGARRSSVMFRLLSILWVTGLLAVPLYIAIAATTGMISELVVAAVFYTFFVIQTAAAGSRLGNFGPLPAFFFPVHLVVFLSVLLRASVLAASGHNVSWKGRRLDPESRN